jgi:phage terminase Nu1 subunit (DNA packaging protein)
MVVVLIDGKPQEINGRLEAIVRWLLEQREEVAQGHKTIEVECHGKVIKPKIAEHFDPLT